jgi:hypothetical protein
MLRSSAEFHSKGGKLVRLEFPRTEAQHFGDVAIVWSSYVVETELDGKCTVGSSRVTEIFVWQQGRWINPGWHTDEEKRGERIYGTDASIASTVCWRVA